MPCLAVSRESAWPRSIALRGSRLNAVYQVTFEQVDVRADNTAATGSDREPWQAGGLRRARAELFATVHCWRSALSSRCDAHGAARRASISSPSAGYNGRVPSSLRGVIVFRTELPAGRKPGRCHPLWAKRGGAARCCRLCRLPRDAALSFGSQPRPRRSATGLFLFYLSCSLPFPAPTAAAVAEAVAGLD